MKTVILLLCCAAAAWSQTAVLTPTPKQQFFDSNGKPLFNGTIYTYDAGTTTLKATFSDSSGTPNSNPIILDAAGRANVWIGAQSYKFIAFDRFGVQQWSTDNIADFGMLLKLDLADYTKGSNLIGYKNPYAGTVSRTVQQKLSDFVSAKDFGAVGDGVADDTAALQALIDTKQGAFLPCGRYVVSDTLILPQSVRLWGPGSNDNNVGNQHCAVIMRAPHMNKSIIKTAFVAGTSPAVEWMSLENIAFDGNGANQDSESTTIDFRGAFITCYIQNVFIQNSLGPALDLGDGGADIRLTTVWIFGVSTSTYALRVNPSLDGSFISGVSNFDQVYVEQISTPDGSGHFRYPSISDSSTWGKAIYLNHMLTSNLRDIHVEVAAPAIDIRQNQTLEIHGISSNCIGNSNATSNTADFDYLVRLRDTLTWQLTLTNLYMSNSGCSAHPTTHNSVIGFAAGVTNTGIWYTPPEGTYTMGYWSTINRFAQNFLGPNYYGERPVIGNSIRLQGLNNAQFPEYTLYEPAGGTRWFWKMNPSGNQTFFGTDKNQTGDTNFMFCTSNGNPSDSCQWLKKIMIPSLTTNSTPQMGGIYLWNGVPSIEFDPNGTGVQTLPLGYWNIFNGSLPARAPFSLGELALDFANKKLVVGTGQTAQSEFWNIPLTPNASPGITQSIVVKGSSGSNCNLFLTQGVVVGTNCP